MDEPMSKLKLLQAMRQARSDWDSVLGEIGNDVATLPILHGGWSVKDTIGHVAYYERWLQTWLEAAARGKVTLATHRDGLPVDERNALIWEENKYRELHEIIGESRQVYDRLYQLVRLLPENELLDPFSYARYIVPFWEKPQPLWLCIAGDTIKHYSEHTDNLRRWIDSQRAAAPTLVEAAQWLNGV